jgi:hypothetical protein
MARFLKLPGKIINTNYIHFIDINKNMYKIHLLSHASGGFALFGTGFTGSVSECIIVDKESSEESYKIVTRWIQIMDGKWWMR